VAIHSKDQAPPPVLPETTSSAEVAAMPVYSWIARERYATVLPKLTVTVFDVPPREWCRGVEDGTSFVVPASYVRIASVYALPWLSVAVIDGLTLP